MRYRFRVICIRRGRPEESKVPPKGTTSKLVRRGRAKPAGSGAVLFVIALALWRPAAMNASGGAEGRRIRGDYCD